MSHDVFISHSSKDKVVADMVVARLELAGVRCWVAPRDIMPGSSWANSIVEGINGCKAMVIVFSAHANQSHHVGREVERAIARGAVVMPLRIEEVLPEGELEYFLSSAHWMDAITRPIDAHLDLLAERLVALLSAKSRTADETETDSPAITPVDDSAAREKSVDHASNRTPQARSRRRWVAASFAIAISSMIVSAYFWQRPSADDIATDYADYRREFDSDRMKKVIIDRAPTHFTAWRNAADAGNHDAQFLVGKAFAVGVVVPKNWAQAFEWWTKGANAGHVGSMAMLGYCYSTGEGVADDQGTAMFWFRKAAEGGDPASQLAIGLLYANGVGVQKDMPEAIRWMRKAADSGMAVAMTALGTAYLKGDGIPRDDEEAARQLHKAADKGFKPAMVALGAMYMAGRGLPADPAKAMSLYTQAASGADGDPQAMLAIGLAYDTGTGVTKNPAVAADWYRKGAEAGNAMAMVAFGRACANGNVVKQDYPAAAQWFVKAVNLESAEAMTSLGIMARDGLGYPVDKVKAHQWFEKGAANGDLEAMLALSQDFATGSGVNGKSDPLARQWLAKAAELATKKQSGRDLFSVAIARQQLFPYEVDELWELMDRAASLDDASAIDWAKKNKRPSTLR